MGCISATLCPYYDVGVICNTYTISTKVTITRYIYITSRQTFNLNISIWYNKKISNNIIKG